MEPSASTIYELLNEPKLTHKGESYVWFGAVFICILNALSIFFADELFRWNLAFQIRNVDHAEPSDWEIAGRYIGWTVMNAIQNNASLTFMEKLKLAGEQGQKVIRHKLKSSDPEPELAFEDNYYSILSRTFSIMNHALSKLAAEIHKPDILVKMPFDAYDEISDYAHAREISEAGRELMKEALNRYEKLN